MIFNLGEDLCAALSRLAPSDHLLICCDFDGTLSPIVSRPEEASLPERTRALLAKLSLCNLTLVSLISGRARSDLLVKSQLGDRILHVGSHGAELPIGPDPVLTDEMQELLFQLRESLDLITRDVDGVQLEPKPFSIAVHVRRASRVDVLNVLKAVREGPGSWPGITSMNGKEMIELAVKTMNKGKAIKVLRTEYGDHYKIIYMGDDVTDELAFRELRANDIGIKVGEGETIADHRIDSPESAQIVLNFVHKMRS